MESFKTIITAPWPWYIVGPMMGATIPLLLFFGNKMLGASSSLQHMCAMLPMKVKYFEYDYKKGLWNIFFAIGVMLGSALTYHFLYDVDAVNIAEATRQDLRNLGLTDLSGLMPNEVFGFSELLSIKGLSFSLLGGLLIGFGVRYAGGCTSGHGFMGLSQMSLSSTIAIVSFFAGGIIMTHLILPLLI